MSLVSMVFSNIKLSRCLDTDEEKILENLKHIKVNDITMIGTEIVQLPNDSFYEMSYWEVEDNNLILPSRDRQHFFLESLLYLINEFFVPRNISLNGYVFALDELFGSFQCCYVVNNRIFTLPDMVAYFEGLQLNPDVHINLKMVSKHMEELIKINSK